MRVGRVLRHLNLDPGMEGCFAATRTCLHGLYHAFMSSPDYGSKQRTVNASTDASRTSVHGPSGGGGAWNLFGTERRAERRAAVKGLANALKGVV